ncbi:MAG: serine hydrolase [Caldilineaceae bacterium]|nr:serine hydrolase [Caldilineaceae bacterium]
MTVELSTALQRSTPEAQGVPSAAILDFVQAVDQTIEHLHSFMLLRHGAVIGEGWWSPYAPELPHMLFSLSKSFTSTAVGLAVDEGLLSVEDKVISFFPDDLPAEVNEHMAAMTVHHLLSMNTGHSEDTTGALWQREDGNWVAAFLAQPVTHEPGTHFLYNTGATYMLSAIVQKLTGQTLTEYLTPRLFEPLGIENPFWESCPRGINTGGFGLNVTTEDIARFGQMYLQQGEWQGRQLVPSAWIAEATKFQSDNSGDGNPDWTQGYGYQFWRCRHNAYRGDGAFGQYCIVMPEQDAVLAITSGVGDMQAVLDLVWKHLLPALSGDPAPADEATHQTLVDKLTSLSLPVQAGDASSPLADQVSGKVYRIEDNEAKISTLSLAFGVDETIFHLSNDLGDHRIVCGHGEQRFGVTTMNGRGEQRVAASAAWTGEDVHTLKLYFIETPFSLTVDVQFQGDEVTVTFKQNVNFGPTEQPPLKGTVAR